MDLAKIFVAALLALVVASGAHADDAKRNWSEEKCFRYQRDWTEALRRWGRDGLTPAFVAGNDAFIDADCHSVKKICPRTARERELVDVLAIRVVNEGMSSTFLPFDCPN